MKKKQVFIKTQKQLDSLCKVGVKEEQEVYIEVDGLELKKNLNVRGFIKVTGKVTHNSTVFELHGSSRAELRDSSSAVLWDSSSAVLYGSSSAVLWDSSSAVLYGSSSAVLWDSSRAVLYGSSSAVLYGSSRAVLYGSSSAVLWDSSRAVLYGSSSAVLYGSSSAVLYGSSSAVLWDSSSAVLWDSSSAVLYGSSRAELRDSSSAMLWVSSSAVLWDSSVSWNYSLLSSVSLFGWSVCYKMFTGKGKIKKEHKTATIIEIPDFKATWKDYESRYPVKVKDGYATMYKAVHKSDEGKYFSDYNKNFFYEIGKEIEHEVAPKDEGSCSMGIHVAHKSWARSFGFSWQDMALLECKVKVKDIVISKDCDGKVRTSRLTVIREVPKEEWYA